MNYSTDPALQEEVLTWLIRHQPTPQAAAAPNPFQQAALGDLPPTELARELLSTLQQARTGPLIQAQTEDIPLLP